MKETTWIPYDKILPYIENRNPYQKPTSYLKKAGKDSYQIVEKRRPSNNLLVNNIREEVDKWRDAEYPGVTETTRTLLFHWFYNDHFLDNALFGFWFCQREAIETLIYLYEVKKYDDLIPVISNYAEKLQEDIFKKPVEFNDSNGNRKLILYYPQSDQQGQKDLPPKGLLRYAFKMATGSGKTFVMALIIVWSYFNRLRENDLSYPDNFVIIAPNIIVYERLAKDFNNNMIFYNLPLVPENWRLQWNLKVTLRDDDSPLNPSGNLIVNNIQQLYINKSLDTTPSNIIEEILGPKPQKNLNKPSEPLINKIKKLKNIMVLNDEAHHIHGMELQWHQTLMNIHNAVGINLWLDFSATPKDQDGMYFPWIIVDYPLAQAVEDRIVKSPLIVHRVDKNDPNNVSSKNIIQKYGEWIMVALERWKEHNKIYSRVGKKPVLFIMTEKNIYADKIAQSLRNRKDLNFKDPENEIVVIHVKTRDNDTSETEIIINDNELDKLRELVRKIDEPDNKVKIIVSNMMLREGWDVQNVTIILGLRPFTSQARILPEQAVGRGLRLMRGISPDNIQTLEVMGTSAFEKFILDLEKEGVGINTVNTSPPLPIVIEPEKSRLKYDIDIPLTTPVYQRNYKLIESIDPLSIEPVFSSDKLDENTKIMLRVEFATTGTDIGNISMPLQNVRLGRELVSDITKEVMKRVRLTGNFNILYPIVESYILKQAFSTPIDNVENETLRKHLTKLAVQEAIVDILSKRIGELSAEKQEIHLKNVTFTLSKVEPFTWRRKHLRCQKTVFNFVAVYNDFEAKFAQFLDKSPDIERFAGLADKFCIDYLTSLGAIRFYFPDFVAVQIDNGQSIHWIIETKGREYEDVDKKDKAMDKWCKDITNLTDQQWRYIKVLQTQFESQYFDTFQELIHYIISGI